MATNAKLSQALKGNDNAKKNGAKKEPPRLSVGGFFANHEASVKQQKNWESQASALKASVESYGREVSRKTIETKAVIEDYNDRVPDYNRKVDAANQAKADVNTLKGIIKSAPKMGISRNSIGVVAQAIGRIPAAQAKAHSAEADVSFDRPFIQAAQDRVTQARENLKTASQASAAAQQKLQLHTKLEPSVLNNDAAYLAALTSQTKRDVENEVNRRVNNTVSQAKSVAKSVAEMRKRMWGN